MKLLMKNLNHIKFNSYIYRESKTKAQSKFINQKDIESYYTSKLEYLIYLKNYRYKLKKCWINYTPLSILDTLNKRDLLDDKSKKIFYQFIGNRTLQNLLMK